MAFFDPASQGGFGGGYFDPSMGGGGFDPYGGGGLGGGGGAGQNVKPMIQASLAVASLSLGFLVVATLLIGFMSKCPTGEEKSKQAPMLMAAFVGALAFGTWVLRGHLLKGFTVLDTLPSFFVQDSGGAFGGGPRKPPQLNQWENWTFTWLLCFCAVVWGGVFILEYYSVQPLENACPVSVEPDSNGESLLSGLLQMRRLVYGILIAITFIPLALAWSQRAKWGKEYRAAENAYQREMFGSRGDAKQGQSADQGAAATSPSRLAPSAGGYTQKGSTELFDAAYGIAELVGYAGSHRYAAPGALARASAASPEPHVAPTPPSDIDLQAL